MERDRKDRSVNWFMEQHGGSLLRLAHITNFTRWQAAQTVLSYPKQVPDGLLDVYFAGKDEPDPFLIEVESFPEQDTHRQIRRDLAMVLLTRDVIPDMLVLVLHPKGNLTVSPEQISRSAHGLTTIHFKVHVLTMWTLPVEEVLAVDDVALTPFLPLTLHTLTAEEMMWLCRNRIERASPEDQETLRTMTHAMAGMRYNDQNVLDILRGNLMALSLGAALLKTPAGLQFIADKDREVAEAIAAAKAEAEAKAARQVAEARAEAEAKAARQVAEARTEAEAEAARQVAEAEAEAARQAAEAARETRRKDILHILEKRFGSAPIDLAAELRAIDDQPRLEALFDLAMDCADLSAFRAVVVKP